MSAILWFSQLTKKDVAISGGKGASLGELTQAGIPVPPGFVIPSSAFDSFIAATQIKQEIAARLAETHPEDINSIERSSAILRDVIHDTPFPAEIIEEIYHAFDQLHSPFVAVRSSATAEDSDVASWAGELETYLNTTREYIVPRIKQCWSSLFTARAIFYRHEKNLIDHDVSVAVVVQTMVQSELSGVAFTVHPVTENPNHMIIEAAFGLGEAIVGGYVTPDSYVIAKDAMTIEETCVGHQTKKLVRASAVETEHSAQNIWVSLGEEGQKQKMDTSHILELAALCKAVECHYGFPCDIEWAYANGKFFITQSRPITTLRRV